MGFMRKALFLGTGGVSGLAGVRANSKKDRTAKATEKLARQGSPDWWRAAPKKAAPQNVATSLPAPRYRVNCPKCTGPMLAPATASIACPHCGYNLSVTPNSQPPPPTPSARPPPVNRPSSGGFGAILRRLNLTQVAENVRVILCQAQLPR